MTERQQFFAAIIEGDDLSPIFGIGFTEEEALADAREGEDPTKETPHEFKVYPCSGELYDRVTDIGGDVVYVRQNGRLVLGSEAE